MANYNFGNITVLVCDDNSYIRRLVCSFLEGFGVGRVVEAHDGECGFGELVTWDPDVVITDWNMGEANGLDLVHVIRFSERSPNPFVPIIMLTGFTEVDRVKQARDAGISAYLTKPISAGMLHKRLCSVVEDHRAFIRGGAFFGPDRRVRSINPNGIPDRRLAA
jgi:two-component system, chemotaxis family, chemotaxis protein CheY